MRRAGRLTLLCLVVWLGLAASGARTSAAPAPGPDAPRPALAPSGDARHLDALFAFAFDGDHHGKHRSSARHHDRKHEHEDRDEDDDEGEHHKHKAKAKHKEGNHEDEDDDEKGEHHKHKAKAKKADKHGDDDDDDEEKGEHHKHKAKKADKHEDEDDDEKGEHKKARAGKSARHEREEMDDDEDDDEKEGKGGSRRAAAGEAPRGVEVTPTVLRLDEKDASKETGREWTRSFRVRKEDLASTGRNPYFVLEPGYRLVFEGTEKGKKVALVISVLDETRTVDGVETRVVEERETREGEPTEVSRNYFAVGRTTGDVYYFGEEVDVYEGGKVVGHEGAWLSGVKGARFGLALPGSPLIGARYYQEVAPGVALDRAEVVSLSETVTTPAGAFDGCLKTEETTPLEPDSRESKLYAPGVGLVQDGPFRLVRYGKSAR